MEAKRIDLHTHSLHSDGMLLPSELLRYAETLSFEAIAITDHVDYSNLKFVLSALKDFNKKQARHFKLKFVLGVEITHVQPHLIKKIAQDAKNFGAKLIICHGETPSEPVAKGTNFAAVSNKGLINILAHPGYITEEEALLAKKNDVYLELSAKPAHKETNLHVAKIALKTGANLIVNTDAHGPNDLITQEEALKLALLCGLPEEEAIKAVVENPRKLLKKIGIKLI